MPVDHVEDGLLRIVQVQAAERHSDELAPRCLERGEHRVVGRVLAGADEEPRAQLYAGNDKRVSVRDRLHTTKLTDRAPPPPCPHRGRGPNKWGGAYCRSCCRSSVLSRP